MKIIESYLVKVGEEFTIMHKIDEDFYVIEFKSFSMLGVTSSYKQIETEQALKYIEQ